MLRNVALALAFWAPSLFAADVRFSSPSQVGGTKLDAGRYELKMQGVVAIFSNVEKGKSFSVVAKPEKMEKKADVTTVNGVMVDGVQRVVSITVAGSDQKLMFQSSQ